MRIKKDKGLSADAAELRHRAEERLQVTTAELHPSVTEAEAQRLVHELEVHRIELEMQNAELRQARDEAEKAVQKYADLYDFAPVGYFTLDRKGTIRSINLTGASLIGIERSRLNGRRFDGLVANAARPVFAAFLETIFTGPAKESCEVELLTEGNAARIVQIEAVAAASGQECRMALIDIT